jgi:Mg2+/Co2+ transporter CorB
MHMRVFVSRLLSVSGLFIIINALYYVYQLVLNHGLTVSLYGGMSSIIAWTVLASLPAIALSVFLTRYVTLYSDDSTRRDTFIRAVFVRVVRAMIYLTPPIVLV